MCESLDNLTPADVYLGRAQDILTRRENIKLKTIQLRRRRIISLQPRLQLRSAKPSLKSVAKLVQKALTTYTQINCHKFVLLPRRRTLLI